MAEYAIKTTENPTQDQIDLIGKSLKAYNESKVGPYQRRQVVVEAFDESDTFVGGVYGWLLWGWLYVDYLWVHESHRHGQIGSRLLHACEQFAVTHGIQNARLHTGSFQAPDFYKKHGYEVFATLDEISPNGEAQVEYFMKKRLSTPSSARKAPL
jgi:ribosomal protein S18 acetylase RimI-like enzyme